MKAPQFWYKKPSILLQGLSFLCWPYALATEIKQRLGKSYQAKVPVICVGNLTVGGTGKTPVVIELIRLIQSMDHNPHILLRGYRGKERYVAVSKKHNAEDVGDEALLLQKFAPTWVGKDRGFTAQLAEKSGACCLVMDDGLQNPSLQKDFSFIVIDGAVGFGNRLMLPLGPLRQPILTGLSKAQAVILIGDDKTNILPALSKKLPVIRADFFLNEADREVLQNQKIIGFAGIGRHEKFELALKQSGLDVVAFHSFADHHYYSVDDLTKLKTAARKQNAILVTTEKDYVRLSDIQKKMFAANELMYVRAELKWQKPEQLELLLYPLLDHH